MCAQEGNQADVAKDARPASPCAPIVAFYSYPLWQQAQRHRHGAADHVPNVVQHEGLPRHLQQQAGGAAWWASSAEPGKGESGEWYMVTANYREYQTQSNGLRCTFTGPFPHVPQPLAPRLHPCPRPPGILLPHPPHKGPLTIRTCTAVYVR